MFKFTGPVNVTVTVDARSLDDEALQSIQQKLEILMATNQQASDKLDQLGEKLDKVSGETTNLVQQVRDLKEAAAAGSVSDDVLAKIDGLLGKAKSIDDQVDDLAPNPTPTPPGPPDEPPADSGTTSGTGV